MKCPWGTTSSSFDVTMQAELVRKKAITPAEHAVTRSVRDSADLLNVTSGSSARNRKPV